MNKATILANGEFPKRCESLQAIKKSPLLICCDGAYKKLVDSGIFDNSTLKQVPQIHVIGDGDSLPAGLKGNPPFPTLFVEGWTDQECNDLTKAVRYALTLGTTEIDILGATGLREDHTLGNISLLGQYCQMPAGDGKRLGVRMLTDCGVFMPVTKSCTVPTFKGQQVSIFALTPGLLLTSEGLKYPIERRELRWWWEATLNEALGNSFSLTIEGEGVVLVFLVNG